jgi:hypothetical protein
MTAVIAAADVDHAVEWLTAHADCLCYGQKHADDCPLDVGLRLLREARRVEAFEPPL